MKKAEAKCAAAEQSLKEERGREGSFHQHQQVRPEYSPVPICLLALWARVPEKTSSLWGVTNRDGS